MRVGFIGGVNSSFVTLSKLVEHRVNVTHVFGYKPSENMVVSGYNDFEGFCKKSGINYTPFTKVNDLQNHICSLELDVLFIVGISQLVNEKIVQAPKLGCVGYHPTLLPRGRGRAPIAWLVHEHEDGAANFFLINEVADSGPIFVQHPFKVTTSDNAESVEAKLLTATKKALDKWLPDLKNGIWNPTPQNELYATEYGIRKPEDGLINWSLSASSISKLIRAASSPHPGAYTFFNDKKVKIEKCRIESELNIKGCIARILKKEQNEYLIQSGDGLLWVTIESSGFLVKVGDRLGYLVEHELYQLKNELNIIKARLGIHE